MPDYEVTRIDQSEDPLTHFALFSDYDPIVFESVVKESKLQPLKRVTYGSYLIF